MRKIYKHFMYVIFVGCMLIQVGCSDFLNTSPTNMLNASTVYTNENAFKAHMANLYSQMPFPDDIEGTSIKATVTDEMVERPLSQSSSVDYDTDWWSDGYHLIRALNKTIKNIPDATGFSDSVQKKKKLGEVKFLRAYAYYSLARRYGGVPVVTEAQNEVPEGDPSELQEPRNKESKVFNFIEKEMTEAINMMSDASGTPDVYRINRWSALAFKSEAMLTAASIAKYGDIQLDGVVGIPQTEADHYWKSARDAAKKVINSGKYKLYNQDEDKAINYYNLFFNESKSNKERIFVKAYTWPENGHRFDQMAAPRSHRSAHGWGGKYNPTFDMVESYEYINDRDGSLKLQNGSPIDYADPTKIFKGKDPRFFGSILFPGSPWKGTTLEIYAQIIEDGQTKDGHGADGIAQPGATSTGFYILKYQSKNPPRAITSNSSDVDFISMRYAEVLLNYAEAVLELNNEPEAREYVNMIRQRAGIQKLGGPISMNDYRHERKIELAFEGNRYWDMKRWRIYDDVIDNKDTYALWPTYSKDKDVYTFSKHKLPTGKFTRTFSAEMYYNKIPSDILSNNPLLIQNPGY